MVEQAFGAPGKPSTWSSDAKFVGECWRVPARAGATDRGGNLVPLSRSASSDFATKGNDWRMCALPTMGHLVPSQSSPEGNQMNQAVDAAASSPLSMVVGLDFTDADGPAFDQAAQIARRVPHSGLHLVHVFHTELSAERSRELVGHLRLYVNEKAAIADGLRGITVGIHLRAGKPAREIVQLAMEVHADIIVVGSHRGPHLKHWSVGSTAEKLIAGASCPVFVASPMPKVPEITSPRSNRRVRSAFKLARRAAAQRGGARATRTSRTERTRTRTSESCRLHRTTRPSFRRASISDWRVLPCSR